MFQEMERLTLEKQDALDDLEQVFARTARGPLVRGRMRRHTKFNCTSPSCRCLPWSRCLHTIRQNFDRLLRPIAAAIHARRPSPLSTTTKLPALSLHLPERPVSVGHLNAAFDLCV